MVALALHSGIPVHDWLAADRQVLDTALTLIAEQGRGRG